MSGRYKTKLNQFVYLPANFYSKQTNISISNSALNRILFRAAKLF
jgi:hypothetical protein